ncbi:hypothetical protein Tco_0528255 [Tanacetum coccineum]
MMRVIPEEDNEQRGALITCRPCSCVLIQLTSTYTLLNRVTASISDPPQRRASVPLCECAERLLALPNPTDHHLFSSIRITTFFRTLIRHYLYHHHHPMALHMLRDLWDPELLGIRQRDALPSPVPCGD